MIQITDTITIAENEIQEEFVRASGPGGQNVNKVSTVVQLRFDIHNSSLSEAIRERLLHLAGRRVTTEGILIIEARRFRAQEYNRQDARNRLVALIRKVVEPPKPRQKTKPTLASKTRRLESKRHRGQIKKIRRVDRRTEE
jgi:ribosome-associated protein